MNPNGKKVILLSLIVTLLVALVGVGVWVGGLGGNKPETEPKVVTQKSHDQSLLAELLANQEEIKLPETDTSDWQVYLNDKYGFEMKLPTDWFVEEKEGGRLCLKTSSRKFYFEGGEEECGIAIDTNYYGKFFKSKEEFVSSIREMEKRKTISGISVILVDNKKCLYYSGITRNVFIERDNNLWSIVVTAAELDSISNSIASVFAGSIQTFHFTK